LRVVNRRRSIRIQIKAPNRCRLRIIEVIQDDWLRQALLQELATTIVMPKSVNALTEIFVEVHVHG
jgi:hypothetical protein